MRRKGHYARIHDLKLPRVGQHQITLVLGLDPESRGGIYSPRAFAVIAWERDRKDMTGWGAACTRVKSYHRGSLPVPVVSWSLGYRLRHVGGLKLYKLGYRAVARATRPA